MKMNTIIIRGEQSVMNNTDKYKLYDNVTNEFSDMKYLVCREYCSKNTIVGAFNNFYDAQAFCDFKNKNDWD